MLKIWKDAWKKSNAAIQPLDGERSKSQEVDCAIPYSRSASPAQSRSTAPPDIPDPRPSHESRTHSPEQSEMYGRPRKRQKTKDVNDMMDEDNISNHLPEVMDLDDVTAPGGSFPNAPRLNSIIEAAKTQNCE